MLDLKLGYACINTILNEVKSKEDRITTNRTMIKKTFTSKGLPYASELGLKNCKDLIKILEWNERHDIKFFRLSSDIFPWASEYDLSDLPNYEECSEYLAKAGDYAKKHNHRITTHPGPVNVLGSPRSD